MTYKEKLCYLAGFFDGEGTIGLYWYKSLHGYKATISVTNTNKSILKDFQNRFGGCIYDHKNPAHCRQCSDWRINSNEKITYFLETMTPYLQQKKKQSELLMKFCNTISKSRKPITSELQKIRKKLADEIKAQKGR